MNQPRIEKLEYYQLTEEDGTTWVRLGRMNWACWMGESLEIENDPGQAAILEALFQTQKQAIAS